VEDCENIAPGACPLRREGPPRRCTSKIGVLVERHRRPYAGKDIAMALPRSSRWCVATAPADGSTASGDCSCSGQNAAAGTSSGRWSRRGQQVPADATLRTFVKGDGKQTVEQLLKTQGATINGFVMYVVGEGIEKKKDDFAAEVAAMQKT
jgi:elongation factor Ts